MYIDNEALFSKAQSITETAISTNIVNLGDGDSGPSENVSLYVNSETPIVGDGPIVVQLHVSDELNADQTSLVTPTMIAQWPVDMTRAAVGGKLVAERLPHFNKKYARLSYLVTGSLTGAVITAGLVLDAQSRKDEAKAQPALSNDPQDGNLPVPPFFGE